ncbi:MAG: hypothetical protein HZA50_17375 [Planctomycetes bacterium]|nr:hypothetical protein [Planctomycetota bacterium]
MFGRFDFTELYIAITAVTGIVPFISGWLVILLAKRVLGKKSNYVKIVLASILMMIYVIICGYLENDRLQNFPKHHNTAALVFSWYVEGAASIVILSLIPMILIRGRKSKMPPEKSRV